MKTILVACDKFKGSLRADEACEAIRRGLLRKNPGVEVIVLPMADGGEGTVEQLVHHTGGRFERRIVQDPLGRNVEATFGVANDNERAFIEMSAASGIWRLKKSERNPLITSTFGTGQLVAEAFKLGARHIYLGIGGSATHDAGLGMMSALGVRFLNNKGVSFVPTGGSLTQWSGEVNVSDLYNGLRFTMLCDVDNPLIGDKGAARVYAPQKGADDLQVQLLEEGSVHISEMAQQRFGKDLNFPGAGAGGGIAAGTSLFFEVDIRKGVDVVADLAHLDESIEKADIVITGEGKVDSQSLHGKVVDGVVRRARKQGKRTIVVAGRIALTKDERAALGANEYWSLDDGATDESILLKEAAMRLEALANRQLDVE